MALLALPFSLACGTTSAARPSSARDSSSPAPATHAPPAPAPAAQGASSLALFHAARAHLALQAGDGVAAEAALVEALSFDHTSALLHAWRSQAALLRGEPGQALGHADRALQLDPASPEALQARVDALWALGRQSESAAPLAALVRAQPTNIQAAHRHMQVLLAADRVDDAHAVQAALSAARPQDDHVHRLLADLCFQRGSWGCALKAAQDATRRVPQDVSVCLVAAHASAALTPDATAAFDRCIALAPQDPDALLPAWRASLRQGRVASVLTSARSVAAALQHDPDALAPLVEGALGMSSPALAAALLERAPTGPASVRVWRAAAAALEGRCQDVPTVLGDAAADVPAGALLRVRCLVRLGRHAAAAELWDRHAAALLPLDSGVETGCRALAGAGRAADALALVGAESANPGADLERLRCAVVAGQPSLALDTLAQRLRRDPDDHPALMALGIIHADAGNLAESIHALRALHALDPADPEVRNALAYTLLTAGQPAAEPLRLARAAAAARPDSPEVLDTLGVAQLRAGDAVGALATLQRAVAWLPHDAELRLHLGEALLANGDAAGARQAWLAGRALLPWDARVAALLAARLESR